MAPWGADARPDAPSQPGMTLVSESGLTVPQRLAVRSTAAVYEYTFSRRRIADPVGQMRSPRDAMAILRDYLRPDEAEQERLVVALLNIKNVVIGIETLYVGNASGIPVRVAEVFRGAVRLNAIALIVAHNHPSGDPTPSLNDLAITAELADAARLLDVEFLDHVILGGDGQSASLRALGHLGA
ncbi:MAG: JAB domain-containing protein [Chloroflexota bacterium]